MKVMVVMNTPLLICVFILIAFFAISSHTAFALTSVDISVKSVPEIPGPNETATISISSYATDLERANITWYVDNQTVASGTGKKSIPVITKGIGERTTIRAVIGTASGVSITKDIIIQPGDIDLVWEVDDASTPPFYKGKKLPARESLIRVSAIPNMAVAGKWLQTEDLIFDWSLNSERNAAASGFNKSSYLYRNNYLKKIDEISVKASGITQNVRTQKLVSVPMRSPFILFYEDSPSEGMKYERALVGGINLESGSEINIVSTPYFFSASHSLSPELTYDWKINDAPIATPNKKNRLTLRAPDVRGSSTIDLSLGVFQKLFQDYETKLIISY